MTTLRTGRCSGRSFSGWGYVVAEADDGGSAVGAARSRPFDLILMDIRMIKVSGLAGAGRNQGLSTRRSSVVIMTASRLRGDGRGGRFKKGAYDYLT